MKRQDGVFLHVVPKRPGSQPITWEEFCGPEYPEHAIALDGYVVGPPRQDLVKPAINFNHHEGVVRFATRATCEQVRVALDMGLYRIFAKNGLPWAHIFVDDCDEDVCTSWWQASRWPHIAGPFVTRLVAVQGLLDMSAGAYPIDKNFSILREFAWIYEPYVEVRMANKLNQLSASEMARVIESVCTRIDNYVSGQGIGLPLDTRYEVLRQGAGWTMVKVVGYYARAQMCIDGVDAFVNFRGEDRGGFVYSVGCGPFSRFPMEKIRQALSEAESDRRAWGGADTIFASPRGQGSTLNPDQVFETVEQEVKKHCFNP